MLSAFLPGLLLGLSLIVAIGAQNAFVLRQGLRGEHVLAVCATCAVSDALLILAGVGGFAQAAQWLPWLETATRYAGAAFLLVYGLRSFRSAWRAGGALDPASAVPAGLGATLATCLALTWLNPHVYLDTVVLVGSVSTQFAEGKHAFALGAMTASLLFFFALGYGARLLRPVFARPGAWRALDTGIGLVMCAIAVNLVA
ncbi:amino acid transporter [Azospirillum brasilense]|uniref:Amino acid transporter n=1 Tax=Azospirillum brasilense TaxID=192 RepID=A0A0P0F4G6_AZOBR|nr:MULTISPECIES: LysE/ArgO family amino acid transporter [Azospirillum]ALJ34029.1 amino acid transporter [Azospirillum brasilense]MDW7553006.1 LysE/ArgO family amino acid transporter [Azospirillum brasilense]MDW7591802.1 LysE/ArgO family amino acid transporter [Azospirillum brasilense]MDW7627921.1 LysE/ArgO family amino acid transporter [Azospirillum brasilense]MDX5952610.1 LysE/ArgO family amino acid transporter [Azospirillum brasilense]